MIQINVLFPKAIDQIEPFVNHINQFAAGVELLTEILDARGLFAYKTDAALYYKVSDVLYVLHLKFDGTEQRTRTIFDIDGLMAVNEIMRDIIPMCSFDGSGSTLDFKRLKERPGQVDDGAEETLPAKLDTTPTALRWQYGQDGKTLLAALQAFGILGRMYKNKLMLDVAAISDLTIFTKEQALHLWSTVQVLEDHRGQLYIPLDAFIEFVNEKLFASVQLVSDIPEDDRIYVKGHVFDRRMLKSALYMVRFLMSHPESGYDHRTGDFDLLCAIKFFQKGQIDTQVAQNKKADVLKKNPELAVKYRFEGGNKGVRVTWAQFDLDWIDHMTGELAQAWKQSMRNLGRMVAVGNVRVIWQILENRQDIVRASATEKAMLADMNGCAEANSRLPNAPPLLSAQQLQRIILRRIEAKKDVELQKIDAHKEVALGKVDAQAKIIVAKEETKQAEHLKQAEAEKKKRVEVEERIGAEETQRYLLGLPRSVEAADRDAKRINTLTLERDFARQREESLRQQVERQANEIERLQQQLMAK